MEHRLGRIDIIAWQGRREQPPLSGPVIALATAATISALLLVLRFAIGAPLPLELLQVAFAVFVGSCALLLTRTLVNLILRAQRR